MRFFIFLIGLIFFTSCDKFSFVKKDKLSELDTIVDFTSVDLSPSFKGCDSLVDKVKKSDCFRKSIHQKIGEELQKHPLTIQDSIDETIYVDLIINASGTVLFAELQSSEKMKSQLPKLDSLVRLSVGKLPKIYPAIKRGIPVATKYQLPIKIVLKE